MPPSACGVSHGTRRGRHALAPALAAADEAASGSTSQAGACVTGCPSGKHCCQSCCNRRLDVLGGPEFRVTRELRARFAEPQCWARLGALWDKH
jgi:hypothetical protein